MLLILTASFVVVCTVTAMVTAGYVIVTERQRQADEDLILAAEPLKPEWIYGRRMDVPRKHPLVRTRNTKSIR